MLKPIRRINMRNALIHALARQGVDVTPDAMDNALVWLAEGDPRPEHLPESITFAGVVVAWPRGRETRVPSESERKAYNDALRANKNTDLLTGEENVRTYRLVYEALVNKLAHDPTAALPVLTQAEIAAAEGVVKVEMALLNQVPVIEHAVPEGVNVTALDDLLSDLAALSENA